MLLQVCCEEVLEEVGYGIQPQQLQAVSSVVSSAGITGSQQAMFFAQVRDAASLAGTATQASAQPLDASWTGCAPLQDFIEPLAGE